jgi:hypothetical protein
MAEDLGLEYLDTSKVGGLCRTPHFYKKKNVENAHTVLPKGTL